MGWGAIALFANFCFNSSASLGPEGGPGGPEEGGLFLAGATGGEGSPSEEAETAEGGGWRLESLESMSGEIINDFDRADNGDDGARRGSWKGCGLLAGLRGSSEGRGRGVEGREAKGEETGATAVGDTGAAAALGRSQAVVAVTVL